MAPLIPRMHLFEIDDQPWFPAFLRAHIQDALTYAWNSNTPLQPRSPAHIAASILKRELGNNLSEYAFIDFCAGGGGPTPAIERAINADLIAKHQQPVDFILTDLCPNVAAWDRVARKNPRIAYESAPIDASKAPAQLVQRSDGKKIMRLFNLAFHHFDDPLAKDIPKNTVETSHGFAIFELQERSFASVVSVFMLGIGTMLVAPFFAWKLRSPATLVFVWLIPILPFVLVFDGLISSLRTRTPEEVESLLRSCGADTSLWEMRSGSTRYIWPCGYLNWIVCKPVDRI